VPEFLDALRAYNGLPAELLDNSKLLGYHLPILRADFALGDNYSYRPEPRLPCPVTAFGGRHDLTCTQTQLAGWQEITSRPIRIRILPGDHFFIRTHPSPLLSAITEELQPHLPAA
jgi:medium-chain acyl-[acyl-carrier-protein] hydrolase